jgi:ubiquinol-cytochrome c reductase cytochrome b subunit
MGASSKALGGAGNYIDDRFHAADFLKQQMKKVFPDHWSFMLGEIALYSFIILLLTGVFLTLFFNPSMQDVVYHGSYTQLNGVRMSQAYESTLRISFDIRGGLLMRQIHHWAALIMFAAILAHMLRIFFTGAFRKPRELNWVIGVIMLTLVMLEGLFGYSLPDDLLSGIGVRLLEGVLLSIPVVGTYITMFLFGGEFPGDQIIPRLYSIHILLIPAILLALVGAHVLILWHQKHTQWPGKGNTNTNVVGGPAYPAFAAKTGAYFFFTFGITTLLSTFAQVNPIWMYGPFTPTSISADSQPDFYMGFLEGSLRMMPAWEVVIAGRYTLALSVLVPALLYLGLVYTVLGAYPFIEKWITGDNAEHHILDRPRNNATRTAFGAFGITVYGITWLAGANDVIAVRLSISLYATTWFFRIAFIVLPFLAFIAVQRICLGMQRRDADRLAHGYESGIVKRLPSGEIIEVHKPLSEAARARIAGKTPVPSIEAGKRDENGLTKPGGPLTKLRARLNRAYTENDIPLNGEHEEHPALEEPAKH